MSELLTRAHFDALVGRDVELVDESGVTGAARLTVCEDLPASPGAPRVDPFRVEFVLTSNQTAGQGLYRLRAEGHDGTELFLVPVGPGADGRPRLEAIFN